MNLLLGTKGCIETLPVVYKYFPKLPETDVYEIIDSAVVLEKAFVDEILPQKLTRMDSRKMKEYVIPSKQQTQKNDFPPRKILNKHFP